MKHRLQLGEDNNTEDICITVITVMQLTASTDQGALWDWDGPKQQQYVQISLTAGFSWPTIKRCLRRFRHCEVTKILFLELNNI